MQLHTERPCPSQLLGASRQILLLIQLIARNQTKCSFRSNEVLASVGFTSHPSTKGTCCESNASSLISSADCLYCDLIGETDSPSHHMITSVAERGTLTRCTASAHQLADWTKASSDHRELPHLFTGLLVSLLLLSLLQRAPWQRALQSQSEKTNPQRSATPTLMKETLKNVISPISRLIKLCNRRDFERIIWRGAVMCSFPLPFSLFPSLFAFLNEISCKFFFFFFFFLF